jgi:acyl-CoA reductase-like NAD-dependent aldehyde dehydrogenase
MKLISTNPSKNFERIGDATVSTEEDVAQKVALAREAFPSWAGIGLDGRIKHIKKLIAAFDTKKKDLSALMSQEMGMPILQAADDLIYGIEFFLWYCDHAHESLDPETTYEDEKELHQVFREPRGVVAAIVPWNFPFSNFVWQVGQNLVCGNTIVFKHSEETPLFGKAMKTSFAGRIYRPVYLTRCVAREKLVMR